MIFPGMDPYLEDPALWPDVHNRLIVHIADRLQPLLRPNYFAATGTRVFVEGTGRDIIPDVSVRERPGPTSAVAASLANATLPVEILVAELEVNETFVEIRDLRTNREIVAVLEVVSPTNKYAGPGRESYLAKQGEVRSSRAHLIEIDLLRAGPHVVAVPEHIARRRCPYEYLSCINRAEGSRARFQLYPTRLRETLPQLRIPLAPCDDDVVLDLQAALKYTYDAGGFGAEIAYDRPCLPPLSREDQAWADEQIRATQLQS
jgi:hypothetical protein